MDKAFATRFAVITVVSLTLSTASPAAPAATSLNSPFSIDTSPRSCGPLIGGIPAAPSSTNSPNSPRASRLRNTGRWIVGTTVACSVLAGGGYACHVVIQDPTVRAGFFGAILTLAFQMAGTEMRRYVAPQLNWAGQWLDRLGYSVNNYVLSRFRGKPPVRSAFGDLQSPDIAPDLQGRFTAQQKMTADRIEGLASDFDWLGNIVAQMIRNRHYDDAASQFVATVGRLAYTNEEVFQRTVGPHAEPMVRELLMFAFRGHFVDKMGTLAKEDPTHVPEFEKAVQRVLNDYSTEFPTAFSQYRPGMTIVMNDWMKELVSKLCEHDWCVAF